MNWLIIAFSLVLWLLGMITSIRLGGFIHILLAIAALLVLYRVVSGPEKEIQKQGNGTQGVWKKP